MWQGQWQEDPHLTPPHPTSHRYALQQTPTRAPLLAVFDGLELATMCGDARPAAPAQKPEGDWPSAFPAPAAAAAARTFYVDPSSKGSDDNAGTLGAPFATVAKALAATRKAADIASAATGTVICRSLQTFNTY